MVELGGAAQHVQPTDKKSQVTGETGSRDSKGACIDCLADELLLQVFAYLPLQGIANVAAVSRRWNDVVQDNAVWKVLTARQFYSEPHSPPLPSSPSLRQLQQRVQWESAGQAPRRRAGCSALDAEAALEWVPWKFLYAHKETVRRKWDDGFNIAVTQYIGHASTVTEVTADGDRLYSASHDGSVISWDMASGKRVLRFTGHTDWVTAMRLVPGHVITGSLDRSVRLWDRETGTLIKRFAGHEGGVSHLIVLGADTLVSASLDRTLRVWSIGQRKHLHTLRYDGLPTALDGSSRHRVIVSGYMNGAVVVWSQVTGKQLVCWASVERVSGITMIRVAGDRVYAGDGAGQLWCWDLRTRKHVWSRLLHQDPIYALDVDRDVVVSASERDVVLTDASCFAERLRVSNGPQSAHGLIEYVVLAPRHFLIGRRNGRLEVWSRDSGKYLYCLMGYLSMSCLAVQGNHVFTGAKNGDLIGWNFASDIPDALRNI